MPVSCAASGCKSRYTLEAREKGITFHRFPRSNPALLDKWCRAMRRATSTGELWTPSRYQRLCSLHFQQSCFDTTGQTKRLRDDVIPSIFNFPEDTQQKNKMSENKVLQTSTLPSLEVHLVNDTEFGASEEFNIPSRSDSRVHGQLQLQIRDMPAIWDPADEAYKDKHARENCWTRILRDLYPHYDGYNCSLQLQINKEVKQRWRSVQDRFQKILNSRSKSGSSPVKGSFSLYEELSFLLTSRSLKSTEGNIPAPDPVEDSTPETAESADDTSALGSPGSIPVVAGTSGICSSSTSSADQSDVPRTQGTSVIPVPITVPHPKRKLSKKKEDKTTKRVNETIDLLNKSAKEDYLDLFGSTIANKARLLPPERLSKFMSSVHTLLDAFEEPAPIAPPSGHCNRYHTECETSTNTATATAA